uniref:Apyrase n=1 Tax=Phaseolus vulgaris TaxID=3885 RepID=V7C4H8_PHAVU|nr:hypothetical protein PHAVU_004G077500g [Phaseolus vulgaris]ESW23811.1 hypothetical protein PHAVU_004G077500g [Phaseolus vulgaris]
MQQDCTRTHPPRFGHETPCILTMSLFGEPCPVSVQETCKPAPTTPPNALSQHLPSMKTHFTYQCKIKNLHVTINYLLGNLGRDYSETVGVVDLGGGSVQMAYAISETNAAEAPNVSVGEDPYVKEMFLRGRKYYLYVHSYLGYGLLAARAKILKFSDDFGNPCILDGFNGSYNYGGKSFKASSYPSGASLNECKNIALNAFKVNQSKCAHMKCTFAGIWNGGGGDGQKNLFVASFFFDRAAEAGFADPKSPVVKVRPVDFEAASKQACRTKIEDVKSFYPRVEEGNRPYLCMDLLYQYALLVDGFGLDPWQQITLVKKVKYHDALVEAAWPLGSAIEAVSSTY